MSPAVSPGPPDLGGRRLYLCTSDRPDLTEFVARCIEGGVDFVQLREKELPARSLLERAVAVAERCREAGVPFLVNDRPDLALACGADGVHVGQEDVSPALCRRILGTRALVGLSTHAEGELDASRGQPVDYVSAGPVEPTPTKPGRPGTGVGYLRYAADHAGRPVFVTGGVTPETVPELAEAGARRFVVVRYLTRADDPEEAARRLRRAVDAVWEPAG